MTSLKKSEVFFYAIFYYGFIFKKNKKIKNYIFLKIRKRFFFKSFYIKKIKRFIKKILILKPNKYNFFIEIINCNLNKTCLI